MALTDIFRSFVAQGIHGAQTSGAPGGGPANANGDPYSYWLRDWVHSNDYGKQILGRELEIYFAPPPLLIIETAQNGGCVLSWPGFATGYRLEFADELAPATDWLPLSKNTTLINGRRRLHVAIPSTTPQQFFRLTKP